MSNDDFDAAIGQAWTDHGDDPRGVSGRLPALQRLASEEPQLERLIALARHLYGPHLAEWEAGSAALLALRVHPAYREDAASGQTLRRALASLSVAGGGEAHGLSESDDLRVRAMAAENLAEHDALRAAHQLQQAQALADRAALPDADPAHRAIAGAANALACTLEDKAARNADERTAMIEAAQAARRFWERAGTWLEVERAEYRLAITWVQAADATRARTHAQNCLAIVEANRGAALERFFAWEALGVVARAAGDADEYAKALTRARAAHAELSPDDQGWCGIELDKLAAELPAIVTSPAPG